MSHFAQPPLTTARRRPRRPSPSAALRNTVPRHWAALRPLAAAVALAWLTGTAATALAAPAQPHWTVVNLGTLGGNYAAASGINNAGQVVGTTRDAVFVYLQPFLYEDGVMRNLLPSASGGRAFAINQAGEVAGTMDFFAVGNSRAFRTIDGVPVDLGLAAGDATSLGFAINARQQVVGQGVSTTSSHPVIFNPDGVKVNLGTLGGVQGAALGINDNGVVVGWAQDEGNSDRPFVYRSGLMIELPVFGGTLYAHATAINNAGEIAGSQFGFYSGDLGRRAVIYRDDQPFDLGSLGGRDSSALALNQAGLVVGSSSTVSGQARAFLAVNGRMDDLNSFNGVVDAGLTLREARDINDVGQIVGEALDGSGNTRAFMMTLDTTVWQGTAGGSWAATAGWSHGVAPNRHTAAFIDVAASLTVTGPTADTRVRTLQIGGLADGNNGIATLKLAGGRIEVLGDNGTHTLVTTKGVLAGEGVLTGFVVNDGEVRAGNLTLPDGLQNNGLVLGAASTGARLNTDLSNTPAGTLRVGTGEQLLVQGTAGHANAGLVELRAGGELEISGAFSNQAGGQVVLGAGHARFNGPVSNEAGGRIVLDGASLRLADSTAAAGNGGLVNRGELLVSFGGGTVYGPVTTPSGGKVILSGRSDTSFHDVVDVQAGGELRVSSQSTAVFFGAVTQRSGALFTGTGTKFYEGGLSVGDSVGAGQDAGDVFFGAGNLYLAEIGGTTPGTGHDAYSVAGSLSFGGTLALVSWAGFTGEAGQRFDLFDWASLQAGQFSHIDSSGLLLADGAVLDISRLYIDGSVGVVAVPEPGTWALWLLGLAALGWRARRPAPRFSHP